MKIIHVIESISKNSGGPSVYIKLLIEALNETFQQVLVCYSSDSDIEIKGEVDVVLVKRKKAFFKKVFNKQPIADIYHGNGLWCYLVHFMSRFSIRNKKPYIITTHGMLAPWSLKQRSFIKKIALFLYQRKDLEKASCIHATAQFEADNIRALGYKNPIAIIPNGINLDKFPDYVKEIKEKRKILFLSRVHHVKGIEFLIKAWEELDANIKDGWVVEIVGNGDKEYINILRESIFKKKLGSQIIIKDPVFGDEKIKTFQEADLFVLPTFTENFGIVIAEALASKVPVITTKGTPWKDLEIYNCGKWIDIGVNPLKEALNEMLLKSPEDLQRMGVNGRGLIEDKYSMESVVKKMEHLYSWIIEKSTQPDFVQL